MNDTNTTTTGNDILGNVRAQLQQRLALLDDEGSRIRQALQLLNGSALPTLHEAARQLPTAADLGRQLAAERVETEGTSKRRTKRTKGDKNAARKRRRDEARAAQAASGATKLKRGEQPRLVDWVRDVLAQGEPLDGTSISERVLAAGYKTSSANFRQVVHMALTKSDSFKRNGSGLWTLSAKGAK